MKTNLLWAPLCAGLLAFAFNCAPRPTEKEMEGKIKGKASLRLSDGSTVSQPGSDEYNPYLLHLADGHLVLVFGSNRNGGVHNIFMTKSTAPYDGFEVPTFEPPVVVVATSSPINDPNMISFAAVAQTTSVVLYVNLHTASTSIRKGVVSNPLAPDVGNFVSITNTGQQNNTIIGISADGNDLITTDASGVAYLVNPDNTVASDPFGANLDYSFSATQVRYQNSGQNDAYMGVYNGSPFAATASEDFGPIFNFDLSLADSGLSIGQMTTFYDKNNPYGDMILFAAHDGTSADIYVVTSHTAGMLWSLTGSFSFDTFLPAAPVAEHLYTFDSGCTTDSGTPGGWAASACTAFTPSAGGSFDGTNYAPFDGTNSIFNIGPSIDVTDMFTISAWVYIPAAASGTLTIVSNTTTAAEPDGFRLLADVTSHKFTFQTGDGGGGSLGYTVDTIDDAWAADGWYHVTVTVNRMSGMALIYVDGIIMNFSAPIIDTTFITGPTTLQFGSAVAGGNYFEGYMDNIKIFSYELDPMSVLALYLE